MAEATGRYGSLRFQSAEGRERLRLLDQPSSMLGRGTANDIVLEECVTYDEFNALKAWLIKVGDDGEWPLFLDVWLEHSVEEVATDHREGNKGSIEGPYYVPDAPTQNSPATISAVPSPLALSTTVTVASPAGSDSRRDARQRRSSSVPR